jgi:hypothetical protein
MRVQTLEWHACNCVSVLLLGICCRWTHMPTSTNSESSDWHSSWWWWWGWWRSSECKCHPDHGNDININNDSSSINSSNKRWWWRRRVTSLDDREWIKLYHINNINTIIQQYHRHHHYRQLPLLRLTRHTSNSQLKTRKRKQDIKLGHLKQCDLLIH